MFTAELLEATLADRYRDIERLLREQTALAARAPQAGPPPSGPWRQLMSNLGSVDLAPSRSSYS